jgi:hypothetical protein
LATSDPAACRPGAWRCAAPSPTSATSIRCSCCYPEYCLPHRLPSRLTSSWSLMGGKSRASQRTERGAETNGSDLSVDRGEHSCPSQIACCPSSPHSTHTHTCACCRAQESRPEHACQVLFSTDVKTGVPPGKSGALGARFEGGGALHVQSRRPDSLVAACFVRVSAGAFVHGCDPLGAWVWAHGVSKHLTPRGGPAIPGGVMFTM